MRSATSLTHADFAFGLAPSANLNFTWRLRHCSQHGWLFLFSCDRPPELPHAFPYFVFTFYHSPSSDLGYCKLTPFKHWTFSKLGFSGPQEFWLSFGSLAKFLYIHLNHVWFIGRWPTFRVCSSSFKSPWGFGVLPLPCWGSAVISGLIPHSHLFPRTCCSFAFCSPHTTWHRHFLDPLIHKRPQRKACPIHLCPGHLHGTGIFLFQLPTTDLDLLWGQCPTGLPSPGPLIRLLGHSTHTHTGRQLCYLLRRISTTTTRRFKHYLMWYRQ